MHPPPPDFNIAPILEELGFEDVPRCTGTQRAKVRCLFHGDRKPSASVSQYGYICFACGRSGDAISLIRQEEGLSFADAVARCEELCGVTGGEMAPEHGQGKGLLDL